MGTPRAQQCTFLYMAYRPVNRQLNSMHKVCYSRGKHRWSETTKEAGKREINLILRSQKYFLEEQFSKMSVHRSTWKASGPPTPTAGSYPRVSASVSLGQNLRSCISNTLSSNTDAVGLEATLWEPQFYRNQSLNPHYSKNGLQTSSFTTWASFGNL